MRFKKSSYIVRDGQTPSLWDVAEQHQKAVAQWLMDEGIDSVSLNPDSVLETWFHLAENAK